MHVRWSRGLLGVRQCSRVVPVGAHSEARMAMARRLLDVGYGVRVRRLPDVAAALVVVVVRRPVGVRKGVGWVRGARILLLRVVVCVVEHARERGRSGGGIGSPMGVVEVRGARGIGGILIGWVCRSRGVGLWLVLGRVGGAIVGDGVGEAAGHGWRTAPRWF